MWLEILFGWVGGQAPALCTEVRVFLVALQAMVTTGVLPLKPRSLSPQAVVRPPGPAASPEVQVRQKCKLVNPKVVEDVSQKISELVSEGVLMVYTDGSSKEIHCWRIPRVGGVWVYVPASEQCQEVRLSAPLEEDERQMNNVAKLLAAITGLPVVCIVVLLG